MWYDSDGGAGARGDKSGVAEGAESGPRSQVLTGWGRGAALTFKTGASEAGSQVLTLEGGHSPAGHVE